MSPVDRQGGEARNLDDYALACATDALYHEQHPDHPIDRVRWSHPAPIFGEARNQAKVAVSAYLLALDRVVSDV